MDRYLWFKRHLFTRATVNADRVELQVRHDTPAHEICALIADLSSYGVQILFQDNLLTVTL